MIPKDPPIINRILLSTMVANIGKCEFPDCSNAIHLELAHIIPRRMGGGCRKDVPENIVRLCHACHEGRGHGRTQESREQMRALVLLRPAWLSDLLSMHGESKCP